MHNAKKMHFQKNDEMHNLRSFLLTLPFFFQYNETVKPVKKQKGRWKMKRVRAACITQTLHFLLKEDAGHDYAVKLVGEEAVQYIPGGCVSGLKSR